MSHQASSIVQRPSSLLNSLISLFFVQTRAALTSHKVFICLLSLSLLIMTGECGILKPNCRVVGKPFYLFKAFPIRIFWNTKIIKFPKVSSIYIPVEARLKSTILEVSKSFAWDTPVSTSFNSIPQTENRTWIKTENVKWYMCFKRS